MSSGETGLARVVPAMGSNFGDLDNDGYLDMYLGTGTPSFSALMPNIMLRNDEGRRFQDVTAATGTGHLQKGHGVAFADLDNDGDEDVVINLGGAVPGDNYADALFEKPGAGAGNNWISLRLVGVKSNRAGIGAKIRVRLKGAASGSALRYREVSSGGSFGANSLMQHIGLGARDGRHAGDRVAGDEGKAGVPRRPAQQLHDDPRRRFDPGRHHAKDVQLPRQRHSDAQALTMRRFPLRARRCCRRNGRGGRVRARRASRAAARRLLGARAGEHRALPDDSRQLGSRRGRRAHAVVGAAGCAVGALRRPAGSGPARP